MATARRLHNLAATIEITISSNGTISNSEGYLWTANGNDIEWQNDMSSEVQIVFSSTFDTIVIQAGGNSSGSTVSGSQSAVNYVIEDANGTQISGPYAIQWGQQGALQVSVTVDSPEFTAAVPASAGLTTTGNLQFTADADYEVNWTNSAGQPVTAWTPQPTEIYPTPPGGVNPNPIQEAVPGAPTPVYCTFASANNVPGKGGVRIGGS